ncbi:hypothetical protein FH972_018832 [Carpinus fangiana]|uniref:SAP domain-containing protein n=1 Tax=Carpinus fangiana TaxID=176857 RepID=A0A5N6RRS7_9ROSI|nr:hypothetical protein FH972_018832 [Carpinus fangiana]
MLGKQKGDSSSKDVKGVAASESSRKRVAERAADGRASAKRATIQNSSRQEGSNSQASNRDFHTFTVDRLRALLKARNLSPKGKKASIETICSVGNWISIWQEGGEKGWGEGEQICPPCLHIESKIEIFASHVFQREIFVLWVFKEGFSLFLNMFLQFFT